MRSRFGRSPPPSQERTRELEVADGQVKLHLKGYFAFELIGFSEQEQSHVFELSAWNT